MQGMTLEQLRTAWVAGGVADVTLKGHGAAFEVEIATRSGNLAILTTARSQAVRQFTSVQAALKEMLRVGITCMRCDASEWDPAAVRETRARKGRSNAMKEAHEAAAYTKWLANELQASIDDPRPSVPHEEAMARLSATLEKIGAQVMSGRRGS